MGDTANLEVQHTVVPSLHFGHLSYTPPPGFAGQLPGVLNVPPGTVFLCLVQRGVLGWEPPLCAAKYAERMHRPLMIFGV